MVPEDVPSAHALLTSYLKQFKLAPQLSEEEFAHWLLPREGVVDCFVVKDKHGKVCTASGRPTHRIVVAYGCVMYVCMHACICIWLFAVNLFIAKDKQGKARHLAGYRTVACGCVT